MYLDIDFGGSRPTGSEVLYPFPIRVCFKEYANH